MTNLSEKFLSNLIQRGYNYVDSGFCVWADWKQEMSSFLHASNNDLLDLSETDINDIIQFVWDQSYTIEKKEKKISEWAFVKNQETKYQKEMRNSIDRLFKAIENYRKSEFFEELLKFSAQFKLLAPYNAMMVKTQMPSARYVLTAANWEKKYDRKPKRNARPLVILRKYGPVDYVFEIGDTEPIEKSLFAMSDEQILELLADPYSTTGKIDRKDYHALVQSLSYYGIALEKFRVASSFGTQILKTPCKVNIKGIEAKGHYVISINDKSSLGTAFASICHELGHFFCYHLTAPKKGKDDWWTWRRLSWEQKEFEAEIVSFIICERYGVGNRSWEYLSQVLGKTGSIPEGISIDRIFKAANEVERMLNEDLDPRTCLLYFNDKDFKKRYDMAYPKNEIPIDFEE